MLGFFAHKNIMEKRIHEVQRIHRPGDLADKIIDMVDAEGKQVEDIKAIVKEDMKAIRKQRKDGAAKHKEQMKAMFEKIKLQLDSQQTVKLEEGVKRMMEKRKRKRKNKRKKRSRE